MGEGRSLDALAARIPGARRSGPDAIVTDVTHDSRGAGPGALFVAVRGATTDGHRFVEQAVAAGAAAVAVEGAAPAGVPALVVPDTRRALAVLAAEVHGHPSRHLEVVGVTGTNGKTTVTHLLESVLEAAGRRVGIVGTVGARIAGEPVPLARTTPEASDLQRLLARMVRAEVDVAAIEVSSHALALHRADAVEFAVAAFTNLTQDHLDFHGDMARYREAKLRLFAAGRARHAVVFVEDPTGAELAAHTTLPVTTVGLASGDVTSRALETTASGSRFRIVVDGRPGPLVTFPLPGRFNVANALVVTAIALALGVPTDVVARGLAEAAPVPGRFERVEAGQPFTVVVDYAHTPDAISRIVAAAQEFTTGRVVVVIGAGGDRDRRKRGPMGVAAAAADLVIITSDNPRSEDPLELVAAVAAGARRVPGAEVIEEPDRRRAIRRAVRAVGPGDVVLILGKGHEQGQEIAGVIHPFDDRRVATEELTAAGVGEETR